MNDVVFVLISCFDTERLSSPSDMRAAATSLLRSRKVADQFWLQQDQGINLVWKETLAEFPNEIVPLLEMAKALVQTNPENKLKVLLLSEHCH